MDKLEAFSFAYIVLGVLFVASLTVHPYPGSYFLKPLPILIMAYLSYSRLKESAKWLMTVAFICSAAGDVLLDVDRVTFFVPALVSFLTAHVLFTIVFSKDLRFRKKRLIIAGAIVAYVAIIFYYAELGDLFIPVLIYCIVIGVMGLTASFSDRPVHGVLLGALLFIISDSLIAIDKFITPIPYATILIISIYYCAQHRIGMGMLGGK